MTYTEERKRGWYWIQAVEDGTIEIYAGPFHSRTYAWTKRRVIAKLPKGAEIVFLKAPALQVQGVIDRRKEFANG